MLAAEKERAAAASLLAAVSRQVTSSRLDLSDLFMGAEGLTRLAELLSERQLRFEEINLRGNKLDAAATPALARLLEAQPGLRRLCLAWNSLNDPEALKTLAVAVGGSALEHLDVTSNRLGSDCLPALEGMRRAGLDLRHNALGETGASCAPQAPTQPSTAVEQPLREELTRALRANAELARELEEARLRERACATREQAFADRVEALEAEKTRMLDAAARHSADSREALADANARATALEGRLQAAEQTAARAGLAAQDGLAALEKSLREELRAAVEEWRAALDVATRKATALRAQNEELGGECRRLRGHLERSKAEFAEEGRLAWLRAQAEEAERHAAALGAVEERQKAAEVAMADSEALHRRAAAAAEERAAELEALLLERSEAEATAATEARELAGALEAAQAANARLEEQLRGQKALRDKLEAEGQERTAALEQAQRAAAAEARELLEQSKRERAQWDRVREAQFARGEQVEKQLRLREAEHEQLRAHLARLSEAVQRGVSQALLAQL